MINKMKDHFRNSIFFFSASRGAGAQSVTVKTDWSWVRSPLEEMKYLLKFIFPFLRSGAEAKCGVEFCHSRHTMSPEFGRKWGTECLNTRFPLPILL